jgi:3-hydroxybutyryl-CoA dehydrogenase
VATAAEAHRERVLGLHFFNPVPLMDLVEVVAGAETAPSTVARATAIVRSWDKVPVRSADLPGFIVNRVNRPFTIEALRMLEEEATTVEAIDAAMREGGFPMGPFELMDLAGLDVNLAAAQGVWSGLGRPDRLRPSPIQEQLVADGRLGRKAGRGFYRYADGRRVDVDPQFADRRARSLAAEHIRRRIEGAIAAEASLALQDGVAGRNDIATALRLGAAYPERFLAAL